MPIWIPKLQCFTADEEIPLQDMNKNGLTVEAPIQVADAATATTGQPEQAGNEAKCSTVVSTLEANEPGPNRY